MTKSHEEILTPHEHDVLSGRGNFVNYHAGNEHFRALVKKHKVAYVACPKPQKGKYSKLIYDEIRARNPPGRFLKQDIKTKLWYDIGEKKALDKTRQALREGAPEIQKELCGDEHANDDDGYDEYATTVDDSPSGLPSQKLQLHQSNLSFQDVHVTNGLDLTPVMGMRSYVRPTDRTQLTYSECGTICIDNVAMGVGSSSSSLSQKISLQDENAVLHDNRLVRMLPTLNLMECASPPLHESSPVRLLEPNEAHISHLQHLLERQQQQQQLQQQQLQQQQRQQQQLQQQQLQQQQLHQQQFQQQQIQQQQYQLQQQQLQLKEQLQLDPLSPSPERTNSMNIPLSSALNLDGIVERTYPNVSRSYSDSISMQNKIHVGLSNYNVNNPSLMNNSQNPYEPRPLGPYHVNNLRSSSNSGHQISRSLQESAHIALLPPRRLMSGKEKKQFTLERENSSSSLVVDNIFSAGETKISEQPNFNTTAAMGNKSSRFNSSGVSLSIDDINDDGDQLSSLLNNSMRLALGSKPAATRYPIKRSSSFEPDETSSSEFGSRYLLSSLGVGDMSVATLGDRMSDFGDASLTRMLTDSQAEMSIGNVFDELDR